MIEKYKKFHERLNEVILSKDKIKTKELYHDVEENWFNIKRFNDMSSVRHKESFVASLHYDMICEIYAKYCE